MKNQDNDDRKYKLISCSNSDDLEQILNTSEENGWKLHSWNFCDNSYSVTYVALMVRDTVSNSGEET